MHHGQAHGALKTAPGVEGKSLFFDGAATLVTVPSAPELSIGEGPFTVAAWVNAYAPGGSQQMISAKNNYSVNQREWGLMLDRDAHPRLRRIDPIESTASDVLAAFEASLEQERVVSEAIRGLYRIAQEQGDIDSLPLLHWFIEEQVEEESTVSEIIGRVKLIGDDGSGLLKLDQELGARPGGEAPAASAQ